MYYTPMTKAAMKLCFEAHKDQVDKAGIPYVFHPISLAERFGEGQEAETCVALLHDVLEDTDYTVDDIRAAGMNEEVIEALLLLNHNPKVKYMDYVRHLSKNNIARHVKICNLQHNSNLSRLEKVTEKDLKRVEKYKDALKILFEVEGSSERK